MKYALQPANIGNMSQLACFQTPGKNSSALRARLHWAGGRTCWGTIPPHKHFRLCFYFSYLHNDRYRALPLKAASDGTFLIACNSCWLDLHAISPAQTKSISPVLPFWVSNFFVPPANQHISRSKAFLVPLAPHCGGKNRFTKAEIFADITGGWLVEISN